jgi:hypothetical protein
VFTEIFTAQKMYVPILSNEIMVREIRYSTKAVKGRRYNACIKQMTDDRNIEDMERSYSEHLAPIQALCKPQ